MKSSAVQPRLNQPKQKQAGFTLLEMMIAFSLLALLFLALFSSFTTISRGWEAADRRILKSSDQRLVSEFLRSQLSQTMVVRVLNEQGVTFAFEGNDRYVRYAAPLQPLQAQGGIFLIELSVGSDADGHKLEMRYLPYRPDTQWDEAFAQLEPVLVYGGMRSIRFEYFAAESIEDEPTWESEWLEKPVYPLLLKIVLEDKEQRLWPEIIIDLPQVDAYVGG